MAFAESGKIELAWELFDLINPINHAKNPADTSVYRVEPYVVAADVYAVAPHVGRGGWTWYTGSSGWMYRLITESLLGLHLEVDKLRLSPRMPAKWPSFKMHYRYRQTFYHITIHNGGLEIASMVVDSIAQPDKTIRLVDDHREHLVEIKMGQLPG